MNKGIIWIVLCFSLQVNLHGQKKIVPVRGENDLFGYKNEQTGFWVIKPVYVTAGEFTDNGLAFVCKDETHCGCIDTNQKVRIPFIYKYDRYFALNNNRFKPTRYNEKGYIPQFNDSGCLVVCKPVKVRERGNNRYGLINKNGKVVVPIRYEFTYSNDSFYVLWDRKTDSMIVIDHAGRNLLPRVFKQVLRIEKNRFIVSQESSLTGPRTWRSGVMDMSGREILPIAYSVFQYSEQRSIIIACRDSLYGVLNKDDLSVIMPFEYDYIDLIQGSPRPILFLRKKDKIGFADMAGRITIPLIYDVPAYYHESTSCKVEKERIRLNLNGKLGLLDFNGRLQVPFEYDELEFHHVDTILKAKKNGRYGYVSRSGFIVAPCIYDTVLIFNHQFGIVMKDSLYGCVGLDGKITVPVKYKKLDYILFIGCDYIMSDFVSYSTDSLLGIMTYEGRIVSEPRYESITFIGQRFNVINDTDTGTHKFVVKLNGRYGITDAECRLLFPAKFTSIASDACSYVQYYGGLQLVDEEGIYFVDWSKMKLIPGQKE